jgi:hypothetical protein
METLKNGFNGISDFSRNIIMCPSTEINKYENICRDFMQTIFHLNIDGCFLSDDSTISDFAGAGMPDELIPQNVTLQEFYQIGRKYAIDKIREQYNIEVTAFDLLIDIFEKIEK